MPHPSRTFRLPRPRGAFVAISLLALLLAAPMLVVLTAPLHAPAPEWHHVARAILPTHLAETLLLLGIALVTALVAAVPCAWLVAVNSFPLRGVLARALVLPLALPTYIAAYAYAALLGPTGGISLWCGEHLGVRPDILNLPGLGVVLGLVLFPYVYLPARAAFSRGMGGQLDAARTLGAHGGRRFLRIALPLARPAIAAGALLLAMETLNDYGAVKHYGVRTLTTGIFRSWGGLYDLGSALRLGTVLLALVALLLWSERRARRGALHTTDQAPARRVALEGARSWLATGWCLLVLLLGAGLPLGKIVMDAAATWDARSAGDVWGAFGNTLAVAAMAVACTLPIALLFAFRERYGKGPDLAIRAANLGYAVPGAVIAIGVMALAGTIDRGGWMAFALIGSTAVLVYALTARFLAVGTQPLLGGLRSQARALDEAARTLGASPWSAFLRVNLPLLRPALAAAAILVAIDTIKELPLTLILRPFNFDTLATRTYELASIEQLREASSPALLIVLCAIVPVLLLEKLVGRAGR